MLQYLRKSQSTQNPDNVSQVEANSSTIGAMQGAALVAQPAGTPVNHRPGANVKASLTIASPGAGKRIVLTSFSLLIICGSTASVVGDNLSMVIKEGSTEKQGWDVICEANKQFGVALLPGGGIKFAEDTAVTLEFSGAGPSGSKESVNATYLTADA